MVPASCPVDLEVGDREPIEPFAGVAAWWDLHFRCEALNHPGRKAVGRGLVETEDDELGMPETFNQSNRVQPRRAGAPEDVIRRTTSRNG